jgi:formate C-acetyltransferase
VPALSHDGGGIVFNYALPLELALNNGKLQKTGEQIGPQTGAPRNFKTFGEVLDAFEKQYEAMLNISFAYRYVDMKLLAENAPCTLISSFLDSCLERGVGVYDVGTYPYATHTTGLCGAPDVGDSLAVIKKLVFDDKKISMDRLLNALENNFEGFEDVLFMAQKVAKFGNDNDYVDSILRDVLVRSCDYSKQFTTYKGRKCSTACLGMTANIPFGANLGATPDGRKAGEPLSEGGISPHQGRNVSGATASLNSVAKLDHVKLANGSIYNMRVAGRAVKDDDALRSFTRMIRTYFENGGNLVQFNFASNEMLRAAQRDPEKYKDLLVRVATYSAFFVEISSDLQENIIARNELE